MKYKKWPSKKIKRNMRNMVCCIKNTVLWWNCNQTIACWRAVATRLSYQAPWGTYSLINIATEPRWLRINTNFFVPIEILADIIGHNTALKTTARGFCIWKRMWSHEASLLNTGNKICQHIQAKERSVLYVHRGCFGISASTDVMR